ILINPYCGGNNGSIEVINYINTLQIDWYNTEGDSIGSGPKIEHLGPGEYTCILRNGHGSMSFTYPLHEREWKFYADDVRVTNSECGAPVGRIENLRVVPVYHDAFMRVQWFDEWNNVVDTVGTLRDVPPGTYFLRAYYA